MAGGAMAGGGKRGSLPQTAAVLNLLTDLAFNLLIFFVVCASTEPEKGRAQQVPSSSKDAQTDQAAKNVEVSITRTTVAINGTDVPIADLHAKLQGMLAGKTKPEERIVVVRSTKDTPYSQWIRVTGLIEKAGGVITLQLEEEKEVGVK
jgi:biopolymer transport protein ExbD